MQQEEQPFTLQGLEHKPRRKALPIFLRKLADVYSASFLKASFQSLGGFARELGIGNKLCETRYGHNGMSRLLQQHLAIMAGSAVADPPAHMDGARLCGTDAWDLHVEEMLINPVLEMSHVFRGDLP